MGWSDKKKFSGFELCSPFLTYTPSFIKIGPKSAKFVLWGGLGGLGGIRRKVGVVGSKQFFGFELCYPFLTYTPSLLQIGPKLAKLVL